MKALKKILSIVVVFTMTFTLLLFFSIEAVATSVPTFDPIEPNKIFANGVPIIIKEGEHDSSKTMILYGNGEILDLDPVQPGEQQEADLSEYEIYGGASKSAVDTSSITMTGGKVRILFGGGYLAGGHVNEKVNIRISDTAQVKSVYGGGYENNSSTGEISIMIAGGDIETSVFASGNASSPSKNASIEITGGKIADIYGGGLKHSHVEGDATITIKNAEISGVITGGGRESSNVKGNVNINISKSTILKPIYGGGYKSSNIEGDVNINISDSVISDKVYGIGDNNSVVTGERNGMIKVPAEIDMDSFSNLIGKGKDGNWIIKGDVTLAQNDSITIDEEKNLNIFSGSTLTLNGEIINNGILHLKDANTLKGDGKLSGNGVFQIEENHLNEDDIELQAKYPYTGEVINIDHRIVKTIPVLNQNFTISNWKFEAINPSEVKNVGLYTLKYRKADSEDRVIKTFDVEQVEQQGRIRLEIQDVNNDGKLNANDVLSVNTAELRPQGGTPAYSWRKKVGDSVEEIGNTARYIIKSGDEGAQIYCVVNFSENTRGSLETDKRLPKLPAPDIVFPAASSISKGQRLKDSVLIGGSTQYGHFVWKTPNVIPDVDNTGYEVEFIANAETIAKYEPIAITAKKIPVTVYIPHEEIIENRYAEVPKRKKEPKKIDEKKNERKEFTDVKSDDYFADAVNWAIENKITEGTSENTFSPYAICTRAQIVSFLWRMEGKPSAAKQNSFRDVDANEYYAQAVNWATMNNIVSGTDLNSFQPDLACTRAQAITMIYRYLNSPETVQKINFDDVEDGLYYTKAIMWAAEKEITKGTSANTFSPNLECNRAQIVTFLYRLSQRHSQN